MGGNNGVTCGLDEDVKGVLAARGAGRGRACGLCRVVARPARRPRWRLASGSPGRGRRCVVLGVTRCPRPCTDPGRARTPPTPGAPAAAAGTGTDSVAAHPRFHVSASQRGRRGRRGRPGSTARDEHCVEGPAPTPRKAGEGRGYDDVRSENSGLPDSKNFMCPVPQWLRNVKRLRSVWSLRDASYPECGSQSAK